MIFEDTVKTMANALKNANAKETTPYDSVATVTRIEDGVAWVHIAGGVDETPVKMTVDCKEGDEIQVRVGGGRAWIVGNATSPPTDDTRAIEAEKTAEIANNTAGTAYDIANATNQHFWTDDNGVHVSSESRNATATRNTLWNSLGMLFRKGANNLLAIVTGDSPCVEIYDGQGNNASNVVAKFGATQRIGSEDGFHIKISPSNVGGDISFRNGETTVGHIYSESGDLVIWDTNDEEGYGEGYGAEIRLKKNGFVRLNTINQLGSKTLSYSGDLDIPRNLNADGNISAKGYIRDTVISESLTITTTTGTLVSSKQYRSGNVVWINIRFRNTASVASGSNVFEGTVSGFTGNSDSLNVNGVCYYGSTALVGQITSSGVVTIRNCGSSAITISSSNTASISFTYVVNQ